jgi:hypothetical protein
MIQWVQGDGPGIRQALRWQWPGVERDDICFMVIIGAPKKEVCFDET